MRYFAFVLLLSGLVACLTEPSAVTSFTPQQVSPVPGSVIDLSGSTTISIVGPLSIQQGLYYTMVYVREDGTVFLPGQWGPSSGPSSWTYYPFNQDVDYSGSQGEIQFARFCARGTVTEASFITSTADILSHTALNNDRYLENAFPKFDWNIVNYRVDIPLDYRCQ